MKKTTGILLITALFCALLFGGCAQQNTAVPAAAAATEAAPQQSTAQAETAVQAETAAAAETAAVAPGYYVLTAQEEIDGQVTDTSEYLMLLDDGTGLYRAQDDIELTWDGREILCADGTKMTAEPVEGGIRVTREGSSSVFLRTTEFPDDLEEKIRGMLERRDFAGTYVNENQDTITLTRNDRGTYDVSVSIVRLCQMDGEGNNVDGGIEMALADPNNGKMYAVFFPAMGTYVLRVTQSTWELLPDQTDIAGFIRK